MTWQKESIRHALASKGIETSFNRTANSRNGSEVDYKFVEHIINSESVTNIQTIENLNTVDFKFSISGRYNRDIKSSLNIYQGHVNCMLRLPSIDINEVEILDDLENELNNINNEVDIYFHIEYEDEYGLEETRFESVESFQENRPENINYINPHIHIKRRFRSAEDMYDVAEDIPEILEKIQKVYNKW